MVNTSSKFLSWLSSRQIELGQEASTFVRFPGENFFPGAVSSKTKQIEPDPAGMGAVDTVQSVGGKGHGHSIEALSRLSEVAATMGLITPRHLTLTPGGLVTRDRTAKGRDQFFTLRHQLAMAAQTFEHAMERNVPKIGREMLAAREEPLLLLADAIEAAIIVDHHDDRQVFLKRRLDRKPARKKCAIAGDHHHGLVGVGVFCRERKGDANAEPASSCQDA